MRTIGLRGGWRRVAAFALLIAIDCQPNQLSWSACRRIGAAQVDECSGVERGRDGVLWVHNDSGDSARFFALDPSGALLAEVRVDGARNVDWEDITRDDAGHLYLGDFGNNRNARRDLCVYVVDEPDVRATAGGIVHIPVLRTLPFRYADQTAYPDPEQLNFDCEAMFWDAGALWLLTKHRSDIATTLYRLDPAAQGEQVLEPLASADIGSPVTAADCSADGRVLAVLSYQYLHVFDRPAAGGTHLRGPVHALLIEGRQCEGLCFDGDRLLFTNEQRDIHCLPLAYARTRDRYLPRSPVADVPGVIVRLDGQALEWDGDDGLLEFVRSDRAAAGLAAAAAADVPQVRLGWDAGGLLVHARFRPRRGGAQPVLYLMLGPDTGDRPCLSAGQMAWAAVWAADTLALVPASPEIGQPPCVAPLGPPAVATVTRAGSTGGIDFEAHVPVAGRAALAGGERFRVNVVVLDAAATETAWAAVLDMQPLGNPLLWGHAVLRAAHGRRP